MRLFTPFLFVIDAALDDFAKSTGLFAPYDKSNHK